MTIQSTQQFNESATILKKRNPRVFKILKETIKLISSDQVILEELEGNHDLRFKMSKFKALSLTSDYRVVYKQSNKTTIKFYNIGTHNEVYY